MDEEPMVEVDIDSQITQIDTSVENMLSPKRCIFVSNIWHVLHIRMRSPAQHVMVLHETNVQGNPDQCPPAPPNTRENGTIITATRVVSPGFVATNNSREVVADWLPAWSA